MLPQRKFNSFRSLVAFVSESTNRMKKGVSNYERLKSKVLKEVEARISKKGDTPLGCMDLTKELLKKDSALFTSDIETKKLLECFKVEHVETY